MRIYQLIETEFQGETNPGNYMGPDIDAFGIVINNGDQETHTPETEAERKKRKKEKQDMETVSAGVTESSKDILDELLEDPRIQAMLANILGHISIGPVHENSIDDIVSAIVEGFQGISGSIGPATTAEWRELSTFDAKDVMKAIEVETEHTSDKRVAAKIALSHFKEDPKYYTKLARVEGEKPYVKTS